MSQGNFCVLNSHSPFVKIIFDQLGGVFPTVANDGEIALIYQRGDPRLLCVAHLAAFFPFHLDEQAVILPASDRQKQVRHASLHSLGLEARSFDLASFLLSLRGTGAKITIEVTL